MLNTPTVLAITATPLKEALHGYGLEFAAFAHRAGLDPALLATPNARYPAARLKTLWELAAAASGDPLFGIKVGSLTRPGVFHALGLGIVSSGSVLEALQRLERYSSVVSTNGRLALHETDGEVALVLSPADLVVLPTTHAVDATVVAMCRMLEQCAGTSAIPSRVVFMRPRAAPAERYEELIKCPVHFDGPHIAIVFDAESAARPVLSGNAELAAEADRLSERYLNEMSPDPTVQRVRELLLKAIATGKLDKSHVARSLNQSPSTLQRRLRRAGTSYQDLLDSMRRDLAIDHLKGGRHSLADIAFLLGFADQASFTRAFRRWTGTTPSDFMS